MYNATSPCWSNKARDTSLIGICINIQKYAAHEVLLPLWIFISEGQKNVAECYLIVFYGLYYFYIKPTIYLTNQIYVHPHLVNTDDCLWTLSISTKKALTDQAMTEESFGLLGEEAAAAARAGAPGAQGAQALRLG